ncbi:MAG: phosphoribosylanthranilate isomerase [Acidobacteria bacterium]|nr:phosphoribosylanthranilate isomerase [Acidobacteriota bacterium]
MVKLKICGITNLDDARAAITSGAEYLGFNFYSKSPRFIEPQEARKIIKQLPGEIVTIGIFVNLPRPADVLETLQASGAQMAQLHGDEDAEYCLSVGRERVIKALRIDDHFDLRRVLDYPAAAILLDAYHENLYGGTGKLANWALAREAARLTSVFLAGGLTPDNVAEAIRTVEPFALDVNSGVERAPGRKDADKLRKLKDEILRAQKNND